MSSLHSDDAPITPDDRGELLAIAEESLAQLGRLADSLLDVSRLQAGAQAVFPRPADLRGIITAPAFPRPIAAGCSCPSAGSRDKPVKPQGVPGGGASSPRARARATASVRPCTPSLRNRWRMCVRTVVTDTDSSWAISGTDKLVGR